MLYRHKIHKNQFIIADIEEIIKAILHFYANPEDMQIWKEDLKLSPVSRKEDANVGVIINTDIVFAPTREIATIKVVEDD